MILDPQQHTAARTSQALEAVGRRPTREASPDAVPRGSGRRRGVAVRLAGWATGRMMHA